MKLILSYEFTEAEVYQGGPDRILTDGKFKRIVQDLDNELRSMSKYENKDTIAIEEVRNKIYELLKEQNLILHD